MSLFWKEASNGRKGVKTNMAAMIVRIGLGLEFITAENLKTSKRACWGWRIAFLLISAPFGAWLKKGHSVPFLERG